MFGKRMILQFRPFRHFLVTNGTEVAVVLSLVFVQLHPPIRSEIADVAFVLHFPRVNSFVK